jgi:starch synthase
MNILLASSEVHPYSKTGGLADMVGALAKSLADEGHQVGIVTPLYRGVRDRFPKIKRFEWKMDLPLGEDHYPAQVWTLPHGKATVYFIDQPGFYDRKTLYQENGLDFPDNAERFIFFSKAVAHLARYLPWKPGLVHAHDWQAGLAPLFITHQKTAMGWTDAPATCLTIHNAAYQGIFPLFKYRLTNLPWSYFNPEGAEFYGQLNCLKAAINFSDRITTVSPRYAIEMMTPEMGYGLDGVLLRRKDRVSGILNGADYTEWKTVDNPALHHDYDLRHFKGKRLEKLDLQKEMGLPLDPEIPLFGNVGRLADQKGVDILLEALEELLSERIQFVSLGSGSPVFEKALLDLAESHPRQVAVNIGYDTALAHRIEAGCDFYLMPSLYEPCGLNQLYSLRYGTIPIVRATGGLDDSVIDITEAMDKANGIKFIEYSAHALAHAMRKALALYGEPLLLKLFQRNAIKADFSLKKTAAEYVKVYQLALNPPRAVTRTPDQAPPDPQVA